MAEERSLHARKDTEASAEAPSGPALAGLALLFPGQGSQHPGMGKRIAELSQAARQIFSQADEVLGFRLSRLCFEGSDEELEDTGTEPIPSQQRARGRRGGALGHPGRRRRLAGQEPVDASASRPRIQRRRRNHHSVIAIGNHRESVITGTEYVGCAGAIGFRCAAGY